MVSKNLSVCLSVTNFDLNYIMTGEIVHLYLIIIIHCVSDLISLFQLVFLGCYVSSSPILFSEWQIFRLGYTPM